MLGMAGFPSQAKSEDGLGGRAGVPAPTLNEVAVSDSLIDESVRMREEFGLEGDRQIVEQIVINAGVGLNDEVRQQALVNDWGFIGNSSDAAIVQGRQDLMERIHDDAPGLVEFEGSAGTYFEGSTLVVQHNGATPPQSVLDLANQRLGAEVDFRQVRHSSAELTDMQIQIHEIASRFDDPKPTVGSVAEIPRSNGLEVTVTPGGDPRIVDAVERLLKAEGVAYTIITDEVEATACSNRKNCNSAQRAGVGLNFGGSVCSSGWIVNRGGVRYALTAGHCWPNSTSGTGTSGTAGNFGTLNAINVWENGSHADLRLIRTTASRGWLYANASQKARVVNGVSLPFVDGASCLYGRNLEGGRCGVINSTNVSCSYDGGIVIYGLSRARGDQSGGDSGGAVGVSSGSGTKAQGVAACSSSTQRLFTSIGYLATYGLGTVVTE